MGAQPGDCIDSHTFTLPSHERESLTEEQSAERIANYFAQISQEYSPLDIKLLPSRVQTILEGESIPPVISELRYIRKLAQQKSLNLWYLVTSLVLLFRNLRLSWHYQSAKSSTTLFSLDNGPYSGGWNG